MNTAELLIDALSRVRESVHETVQDLDAQELAYRVDERSNSICWLVWHLTRVQDDHIAGVVEQEQIWTSGGWVERFNLPFPPHEIGYGHSSEAVGAVQVSSPDILTGYYDAVHDRTAQFLQGLNDIDLDRVVDESWDPPVTLGVRLVSVINDDTQHVGQAAFVRGVIERMRD
jgi:uncharacterized damage-inducible protein DinB